MFDCISNGDHSGTCDTVSYGPFVEFPRHVPVGEAFIIFRGTTKRRMFSAFIADISKRLNEIKVVVAVRHECVQFR